MPVPGESQVKINNIYTEYYNIADSYMELEKYDKAIEFYSIALKNKTLFWSAYYKMGRAYALAKNFNKFPKNYKLHLALNKYYR